MGRRADAQSALPGSARFGMYARRTAQEEGRMTKTRETDAARPWCAICWRRRPRKATASSPGSGRSSAMAMSPGWGEALYPVRDDLPTWRGHNEQTMAHCAIAYAKQSRRRRAMAVTSSIGPGADQHGDRRRAGPCNRLPVLLNPRRCLWPTAAPIRCCSRSRISATARSAPMIASARVSRYFDRISRPEHLLTALPRAFSGSAPTRPNAVRSRCPSAQDVQAEGP